MPLMTLPGRDDRTGVVSRDEDRPRVMDERRLRKNDMSGYASTALRPSVLTKLLLSNFYVFGSTLGFCFVTFVFLANDSLKRSTVK